MGQLINSLLSVSVASLLASPMSMCNDSADLRHTYSTPEATTVETDIAVADSWPKPSTKTVRYSPSTKATTRAATSPDPRRPPLNPIKPKSCYRKRKKAGLQISIPPPPFDPHLPIHYGDDCPPLISCSRNVDLRRKSLSERHFFRPVSEDEESTMGKKQ